MARVELTAYTVKYGVVSVDIAFGETVGDEAGALERAISEASKTLVNAHRPQRPKCRNYDDGGPTVTLRGD